ncbi:hypothetical protein DFH09DRAFT_1071988 [Mycena vulgaris]|nr:hypothetical protein DFH09DRAFT_1071988 [Mycena vulgaris]
MLWELPLTRSARDGSGGHGVRVTVHGRGGRGPGGHKLEWPRARQAKRERGMGAWTQARQTSPARTSRRAQGRHGRERKHIGYCPSLAILCNGGLESSATHVLWPLCKLLCATSTLGDCRAYPEEMKRDLIRSLSRGLYMTNHSTHRPLRISTSIPEPKRWVLVFPALACGLLRAAAGCLRAV